MPESPYPMLSVEEALRIVLEHTPVLAPVRVPLRRALGRVLAEPLQAAEPMPPFPAAGKDGYAVVADDASTVRRVIGEQYAGYLVDLRVTPGTAVRITTGAPLPPGADAVIMVELATEQDGWVTLPGKVAPGRDVRPVGEDIAAGQEVLAAGTALGPAELGLAATVGVTELSVYPAPKVAILSTGDELVEPGAPLRPGQIRDSNRFSLTAAVQAAGGEPLDLGIAGDRPGELERKVADGLAQADVLLTSGAVSMGQLDLLKPLLESWGTVHIGRVRMKPGKPLTFATVRGKPVFALPGFPVSSLATFELFARPALLKMQGHRRLLRPRVQVRLTHVVRHDPERTEYQRAVVVWREGGLWATTTGSQASSRLLSMVGANAFLILPAGEGDRAQGEAVEAMLIGEILNEP
jgi:molybdenum cofactor synthesis domain-containing protein